MRKQQRRFYSILRNNKALTPFQKRVYGAVFSIPAGKVRSYKWIAKKIGSPSASRAVGQALKKNPYIGMVPCHRVIKNNGSLGGFLKGKKKKIKLLKAEGFQTEGLDLV